MVNALADTVPSAVLLLLGSVLVIAEAGLLIGFILPGATALFALGLLVNLGTLPLTLTAAVGSVSAVLGAQLGFWRGRRGGLFRARIQHSPTRWAAVFRAKSAQTLRLWVRGGPPMVALCQWVVGVRTLAPRLAALGGMSHRRFALYNAPSAAIWGSAWIACGALSGELTAHLRRWLGLVPTLVLVAAVLLVVLGGRTTLSTRSTETDPLSPELMLGPKNAGQARRGELSGPAPGRPGTPRGAVRRSTTRHGCSFPDTPRRP